MTEEGENEESHANMMKTTILLQLIFFFSIIPTKLSEDAFMKLEKNNNKIHLEAQKVKNSSGNNKKKMGR